MSNIENKRPRSKRLKERLKKVFGWCLMSAIFTPGCWSFNFFLKKTSSKTVFSHLIHENQLEVFLKWIGGPEVQCF